MENASIPRSAVWRVSWEIFLATRSSDFMTERTDGVTEGWKPVTVKQDACRSHMRKIDIWRVLTRGGVLLF